MTFKNNSIRGSIVAVNISTEKGVPKEAVPVGELIEDFGLKGDAHGGKWHRQVSMLGQESINKIIALGVNDLTSGSFAENITTEGIELHTLPVGTMIKINEAVLEVTQIGKECHQRCAIYHQVGDCVMPREGIFVRVIKGGMLQAGDAILVESMNE